MSVKRACRLALLQRGTWYRRSQAKDSHQHDIGSILRESLETESEALALYRELLELARDRSMTLEEYARQMIQAEEMHAGDVDKMLRKPGDVTRFRS